MQFPAVGPGVLRDGGQGRQRVPALCMGDSHRRRGCARFAVVEEEDMLYHRGCNKVLECFMC